MASFRVLIAVDGPQSYPKGVTFRRRNAKAFTEPPDYPGVFYIQQKGYPLQDNLLFELYN